jgi:aminoglycoside phosphotransferase (APT) family kinase protein
MSSGHSHSFKSAAEAAALPVAALAAYLDKAGLPLDRSVPPRQFATGLANRNYLIRAGGQELVLRRPPDGDLPPGAHDMAREHRVLSRLWRELKVAPRSVHLCEDKSVIGVPFQLLEYRPGIVIKGDDTSRIEGQPDVAARLGVTLLDTLVSIHKVDVAAAGLGDFGKPDGFVDRQIAGWVGRAERLGGTPRRLALAKELGAWIATQPRQARAPVLLHLDFKLDNMILDPATLAPVAVVDWDMSTRGDPLFDLATMLSYWTEPGDPPCMQALKQMPTAAPGFPSRSEVAAKYARAMGLEISDFRAFRVLGVLKLAVVLLQLYALYERGTVKDPQYAALDRIGEELMVFAKDIAHGRAS